MEPVLFHAHNVSWRQDAGNLADQATLDRKVVHIFDKGPNGNLVDSVTFHMNDNLRMATLAKELGKNKVT